MSHYLPLACALLVNILLGLVVYRTNSRRALNQQFLMLSMTLGVWLMCLLQAFYASDVRALPEVEFWVRQASTVGVLVPMLFNLLRLAIRYRDETSMQLIRRCRWWLVVAAVLAVFCQTSWYVAGVRVGTTMVEPVYGLGFPAYVGYFVTALSLLVHWFWRDLREATGMGKLELQFILLGCAACLFVGTIFTMLLPLILGNSQMIYFAPVNVIILDGVIAYGIATRHILEVAYIMRRATAYALLLTYLVLLYFGVQTVLASALDSVMTDPMTVANLLATLSVAFSLVSANGMMQNVAKRLFINMQIMDVGATIRKATRVLQSIRLLPDLLSRFSHTIKEAVGTDRVIILVNEGGNFVKRYPAGGENMALDGNDVLVRHLAKDRQVLVADLLRRQRLTPQLEQQLERMNDLRASVVVGIYAHDSLHGIMILGPRLSGRVYSSVEQNVLQMLCDQLAVALENAELFTQSQDSSIYRQILLENLVSGVIAVNNEGKIDVFNREAQRLCGLQERAAVGFGTEVLPAQLAAVLEEVMASGRSVRDRDLILPGAEEEIPVRVGGTRFHNHIGEDIGALLVFNDLTMIRRLEKQMRGTDRLVSIGTLSASMAHEIKNPLVAIKTFTQLLPERYADDEFRETFNSLVGEEVERIDRIVRQLLRFSSPPAPCLRPMHMHATLQRSMRLVQHRLEQSCIELTSDLAAETDNISADSNQLEQVVVNLLLNALEAMDESGGKLHVHTELVSRGWYTPDFWEDQPVNTHIKISVSDTGPGIDEAHLSQLFDPFFTTKPDGTGMGLAVAYGIVQDHNGEVDVESVPGQGTTFHLYLPLDVAVQSELQSSAA